jgi:hypothetical protein
MLGGELQPLVTNRGLRSRLHLFLGDTRSSDSLENFRASMGGSGSKLLNIYTILHVDKLHRDDIS